MKTVSIPSRRWHENTERELAFPDRWEVDNLTSPGLDKVGLSPAEIKEKIEGVGGSLNAFTAEEATCYYAKIPAKYIIDYLFLLIVPFS